MLEVRSNFNDKLKWNPKYVLTDVDKCIVKDNNSYVYYMRHKLFRDFVIEYVGQFGFRVDAFVECSTRKGEWEDEWDDSGSGFGTYGKVGSKYVHRVYGSNLLILTPMHLPKVLPEHLKERPCAFTGKWVPLIKEPYVSNVDTKFTDVFEREDEQFTW